MTSWPFTPTEIFASSRRLSGSTTRTVCSFWFATTSRPPAGGAGLATRSSAEVTNIVKTRANDKRTNMGHLDETAFSLESAEAQRSISFLEVSAYACVSFSQICCVGHCAQKALRRRARPAFSSKASRELSHKIRAASAPVPQPVERPCFAARPIALVPCKSREWYRTARSTDRNVPA